MLFFHRNLNGAMSGKLLPEVSSFSFCVRGNPNDTLILQNVLEEISINASLTEKIEMGLFNSQPVSDFQCQHSQIASLAAGSQTKLILSISGFESTNQT